MARRRNSGGRIRFEDGTVGWEDYAASPFFAHPLVQGEALQRARERRDHLLANEAWYTSAHVLDYLCGTPGARPTESDLAQLRTERHLIGAQFRGEYLYPAFQFQSRGKLHPAIVELLALLPVTDANWNVMFWLYQPTGKLGGQSPAGAFASDAQAVVAAARADFLRDDSP